MSDLLYKRFPHPAPMLDAVADAVRPLMAAAGAYGFYVVPAPNGVDIGQASWANVDEGQVAAAVAATPNNTVSARNQRDAEQLPDVMKAALLTLLDLINLDRQARGAAAITPAQYIAAVKAKL